MPIYMKINKMNSREIFKEAVESLALEFHKLENSLDIVTRFTDKHDNVYKLIKAKGKNCHDSIYITYSTYLSGGKWESEVIFKLDFTFSLKASGSFEKNFAIDLDDYLDYE